MNKRVPLSQIYFKKRKIQNDVPVMQWLMQWLIQWLIDAMVEMPSSSVTNNNGWPKGAAYPYPIECTRRPKQEQKSPLYRTVVSWLTIRCLLVISWLTISRPLVAD